MGVAPWLKVYIADEMCSGRFFMSVILLVDGLHELYAGTAGGGQVRRLAERLGCSTALRIREEWVSCGLTFDMRGD
jgi:hypothetical protein